MTANLKVGAGAALVQAEKNVFIQFFFFFVFQLFVLAAAAAGDDVLIFSTRSNFFFTFSRAHSESRIQLAFFLFICYCWACLQSLTHPSPSHNDFHVFHAKM